MTLSRNSGRVKFIENGIKIVADKYYDDIIEWMKIIPETVIFFYFHSIIFNFFHVSGNFIHIWLLLQKSGCKIYVNVWFSYRCTNIQQRTYR